MFSSLWRGGPRILVLAAIGFACVHGSVPIGRVFGAIAAPILFNVGLLFYALAASEVACRLLLPRVDAQRLAVDGAFGGQLPDAVVFVGHCILRAAMFILFASAGSAHAGQPPAAALQFLPILKEQQRAFWPDLQLPSVLGGQVHRETGPCPGRQCWKVNAQLRTKREQGIGFGQLTRTWNASGAVRFDALSDLVRAHPRELAGLSWDNPYDPVLQLRALVLMDRDIYMRVRAAASDEDRWSFALAGYNGGEGSVRNDRLMCEATAGCDPSRWSGHVEHTSLKARQAVQGYGQSFFEINRSYVRTILRDFRPLYAALDG